MRTSGSKSGGLDVDCSIRMHDWMRAIRTPTQYRVGTSTVTLNTAMLAKAGIAVLLILTFCVLMIPAADYGSHGNKRYSQHPDYNSTYPLSKPLVLANGAIKFRIAVISDPDTDSKSQKEKNTWVSYMRKGYLTLSKDHSHISVAFDDRVTELKSSLSLKGRGMELSELVAFNGKLYSVDDRTGVVFEITQDDNVIPWVILQDGDGQKTKGNLATVSCLR